MQQAAGSWPQAQSRACYIGDEAGSPVCRRQALLHPPQRIADHSSAEATPTGTNTHRAMFICRCLAPEASAVMKGRLPSVCLTLWWLGAPDRASSLELLQQPLHNQRIQQPLVKVRAAHGQQHVPAAELQVLRAAAAKRGGAGDQRRVGGGRYPPLLAQGSTVHCTGHTLNLSTTRSLSLA